MDSGWRQTCQQGLMIHSGETVPVGANGLAYRTSAGERDDD